MSIINFARCKINYVDYYERITAARREIVKKNYKNALKIYNKVLLNTNFSTVDNYIIAYRCAVLSNNTGKQRRYFNLIQKKLDCPQYLKDLKDEGHFNGSVKKNFKKPNKFTFFIDSLINAYQDSRVNFAPSKTRRRDFLPDAEFSFR